MQNTEKIVETKGCKHCNIQFDITDKDVEFYEKVSPIFGDRKYSIPTPTLCPDCRQQRRLSFRNERKLYKRKCDLTGIEMISMYSPDKNYIIYDRKQWWSDKWDALDYGRDFDFERGFFEQFDELMKKVPHSSMNMANDNINSEYTTYSVSNKNVYMSFGPTENEDCAYSKFINKCKNSIDCLSTYLCQFCYEGHESSDCYKCFYFTGSNNCNNSLFIEDCTGCDNCILSVGLKNKKYYYLNKYIGKEKYDELFSDIFPLTHKKIQSLNTSFIALKTDCTYRYANINKSESCTGNMLENCHNCISCFDLENSENCKYSWYNKNSFWSYDNVFNDPSGIRYCYETCSTLGDKVLFSFFVLDSNNVYYSLECFNSNNLFGCIGLKNKSYCIFNKQYTKEEYNILVPKIIEHMMTPLLNKEGLGVVEWGEFFPSSISPFGYNETVAQEYFPLSPPPAREGLGVGGRFNWSDYEPPAPQVSKIISAEKLPENIVNIPDDILNWAIECEITKKLFRIIKPELEFYRKHNLPIPKRHPDQRHLDRMKLRNPRKLFDRDCDKCGEKMKTTYAPKEVLLEGSSERKERVYCEKCYEKEVY